MDNLITEINKVIINHSLDRDYNFRRNVSLSLKEKAFDEIKKIIDRYNANLLIDSLNDEPIKMRF